MKQLIWKEWRGVRWAPILCAALMVVYLIGSRIVLGTLDWSITVRDLLDIAVCISPLAGLVAGVGLFSHESENGTLFFLTSMPISRAKIWSGKVLSGLIALAVSYIATPFIGFLVLYALGGDVSFAKIAQISGSTIASRLVWFMLPLWCFAISVAVSAASEQVLAGMFIVFCINMILGFLYAGLTIGPNTMNFHDREIMCALFAAACILCLFASFAGFVLASRPHRSRKPAKKTQVIAPEQIRDNARVNMASRPSVDASSPRPDKVRTADGRYTGGALMQLLRKEWHDLWYIPLIWAVGVLPWISFMNYGHTSADGEIILKFAWALAAAHIGCGLFSGETQQGTFRFLTILPIGQGRIWSIKAGIGLGTLLLSMALSSLVWYVEYHVFFGEQAIPGVIVFHSIIETLGLFAMTLVLSQISERSSYTLIATVLISLLVKSAFFIRTSADIANAQWLTFSLTVAPALLLLSYWTFTRRKAL